MIETALDFRLDSRVAIVTGASSGIGAASAKALASAGAKVVVVGRDPLRTGRVAADIQLSGGNALAVIADVTTDDGVQQILSAAIKQYGQLDVLVHSAGIFTPGAVAQATAADLDRHFAINVRAPFALTLAAIPHLRPGSSIVFITSTVARVGFANTATYSASKAALDGLMRVMAIELAPRGICVNGIAPGWTATPMNEAIRQDDDVVQAAIAATPAGRLAVPEDIAPSVVFLASPASRFIQGVVLDVGGGYPSLPDVIRRTSARVD